MYGYIIYVYFHSGTMSYYGPFIDIIRSLSFIDQLAKNMEKKYKMTFERTSEGCYDAKSISNEVRDYPARIRVFALDESLYKRK